MVAALASVPTTAPRSTSVLLVSFLHWKTVFRECLINFSIDEPGDLTFPGEDQSHRVQPGDNVEMVLKTHRPVAAEAGQRFNIREGGRTVATGLITRVVE